MSDAHKAALAEGRTQARTIKAYLETLERRRPGRPVTPETLKTKLGRIDARLEEESDVLKRLELFQQRIDVHEALARTYRASANEELEAGFVDCAASYSSRKDISYAAWREVGVPAATLKKAGITRGGS
jgi:hypothetical protein